MTEQCTSLAALQLAATPHRREYTARLVRAGRIRRADDSPGPFLIPAEAITTAVQDGKFDGCAAFVDHSGWFTSPSLRNLAGITVTATWNPEEQSADATIRLYDNPAGDIVAALFDQVLADAQAGEPIPDVGLSLVFYPRWKPRDNAEDLLTLAEFRKIESVDFVFQPAADGRVKDALTALSALQSMDNGHLLDLPVISPTGEVTLLGQPAAADRENPRPNSHERSHIMPQETTTPVGVQDPAPSPETPGVSPHAWLRALQESAQQAMIANSGLPPTAQAHLAAQTFHSPAEVQAAIDAQRQIIADLGAADVVQVGPTPPRGSSGVSLGPNGIEQVELALEALIAGVNPPSGIRPLSGIRELYTLMSGDYEMTGQFHQDRIYLANVTSSTMAGLVANALNKRVINMYMNYPRWWEPIVVEEDFSTLQQVKWISLGGVGELPTVAEGAAYTELTWDDQTETADFVKKGGYLGLTLEAMDKDDTRRLRAAPRALAQAAWLTLGKLVSGVFTDNSDVGPTMADTGALFNATAVSSTGGHANLLTTALSYSQWHVVRVAMMKQPEINSGERLGALTAPKYCLVPIDLEETALQIFASEGEPGTANNDENVLATGDSHSRRMQSARSRVIVVPLWTDTNNWAAVADPNLYPSIGIGYRYGRTPEIFSVASPTAGLMFSNDTLPVKVRFFVAVGPTDWRGLHKSNV
jgi:hypothetical protein